MEKLTSGQLLTLMEKTLKDLRSATSSLESVAGAMHSNLQDGNQLDLFGQEAHHVSPSQSPETRKDKTMSDTSGGHSSSSSASANLQQFLASRLPQQLEQSGSTIYKLTWKTKVTPRQWQYCQLAASALRTKESDCSIWGISYPTPAARDWKGATKLETTLKKIAEGRRAHMGTLPTFVETLAPYPTPCASTGGASKNSNNPRGVNGGNPLATAVSYLETENTGSSQLNPRFSLWLMGFPIEWAYCGERVTPLSRKSQRKS